jgi:gliding motility-associated-like protein
MIPERFYISVSLLKCKEKMFKQLHCTLILILMANYMLLSQNLVYNGSFEQYDTCPSAPFQLNYANYWFSANWGGGGSSEYFNACDSSGFCYVPSNGFTYQYARTGSAYVGTGCYGVVNEGREYVEGTLITPLVTGTIYCVSFYVSLSDYSSYGIDALGVYFTNDSLITHSGLVYLVTPQIANNPSIIIIDKENWVKIEGTFTASGGERFLTIGNFKRNYQTDTITLTPNPNGYAYYLIDDVAVYPCDASVYYANAGGDRTICKGESAQIGMQQYDEYQYKWYSLNGTLLDTTRYITVTPTTTTSYVLWVKDFKYDVTTDTVTVFIDENCGEPPVVFIPNIFTPNLDGNNDVLYVRSEHIKELNFSVYNRWGEKVFESQNQNEGWDGNYKGKPCSPDVYVYHATIVFVDGTETSRKGNVTLVR